MSTVQIAALIAALTALMAYVNARWIRLPTQIGMLAIALAGSVAIVGLDALGVIDAKHVRAVVADVDFGRTLVHGMLGLLLFAGALHVPSEGLAAQKWPVLALSLGGTLASALMIAVVSYVLFAALGIGVDWLAAALFGALISPTDPIAVMGIVKRSKIPPDLAVQVSGESLFNDGVGVVLFTVLLEIGVGGSVGPTQVGVLFAREALGGAAFGLVLGCLVARMLRTITDAPVQVLVTLGLVFGGYAAAEALLVSAPIAAVVAGIVVGNRPRETHDLVSTFWELIDEVLNAVLFLALGLEATRLHVSVSLGLAAAISIPMVLGARVASVAASLAILSPFRRSSLSRHALAVLTWGGLRGGLSVALALSLPPSPARDTILVITYGIVAFAVLVQGLTFGALLRRLGLA